MKGLFLFANRMEDNEALSTLALLRKSGLRVSSASIEEGFEITGAYNIEVVADRLLIGLNLDNYDFLIVPGGPYVKDNQENEAILATIKYFHSQSKPIGAICAAPLFLAKLGLLGGLDFTCHPSVANQISQGNYQADQKAVVAGNIITARSAGAVMEFVAKIIEVLEGSEKQVEFFDSIYY